MFYRISVLKNYGVSFATKRQARIFLEVIRGCIMERIGSRISQGMSISELNEFDQITDPHEVTEWLAKHRPDYHDIAKEEFVRIKREIREHRDQIPGVLPLNSHGKRTG